MQFPTDPSANEEYEGTRLESVEDLRRWARDQGAAKKVQETGAQSKSNTSPASRPDQATPYAPSTRPQKVANMN